MSTKCIDDAAICLGCFQVRYLRFGNPRAHKCGDKRIVWVSPRDHETAKEAIARAVRNTRADRAKNR